jgi:hypothetical protein
MVDLNSVGVRLSMVAAPPPTASSQSVIDVELPLGGYVEPTFSKL